MRTISAEDLARTFTFPDLIEALAQAFRDDITAPPRHHHTMDRPGEPAATLLLMPAWQGPASSARSGGFLGVKIVSVYPGNAARGEPSVAGAYLLMSGNSGEALAVIDGRALTLW